MLSIKHNVRKKLSLDDILNGPDEFGLLDVEAKHINHSTPLEFSKFEEINVFIDRKGRPPEPNGELSEKLLARRLQGYIDNTACHGVIKPYDRHNLLAVPVEQVIEPQKAIHSPEIAEVIKFQEVTSLEDIFSSDMFAQLDHGDQSIFDMTHIPSIDHREKAEEVARQKTCKDFYKFEVFFEAIHNKLKSGDLQTVRYKNEMQMEKGDLFINEGVICLIDEIGEYRRNGEGRYDPRMRVIYENGTESNPLFRSLGKRLWLDETGRKIIQKAGTVTDGSNDITDKDKRAGQIYIVTTTSANPTLKAIPNLVKIGYTEHTVEKRTKNAARDTAFLEAPVKILAVMDCYNLNPNKFESLIHGFFHAQRLNVTLTGKNGKTYHPQEWFSVPLDIAREVIRRIIDGSIVSYRMDNTTTALVKKKSRV